MKRVKRDRSNRAYSKGYQSGVQGKSRDMCPYTETNTRQFWLAGWRDGRADHWAGFVGVSGVHKMVNL